MVTLNCYGLNNNMIYVKKLIEQNQIIFLQETWAVSLKTFDEKINPYNKYKTFHKSTSKNKVSAGRPHGGIGWIISKDIKNIFCLFLSERISYIKINNLLIIGVYMHFNDGKLETALNFGNDLLLISSLYNNFRNNYYIIIIDDFNTDLRRNSKFDRLLNQFLEDHDL